jgi:hypothetical protein
MSIAIIAGVAFCKPVYLIVAGAALLAGVGMFFNKPQ